MIRRTTWDGWRWRDSRWKMFASSSSRGLSLRPGSWSCSPCPGRGRGRVPESASATFFASTSLKLLWLLEENQYLHAWALPLLHLTGLACCGCCRAREWNGPVCRFYCYRSGEGKRPEITALYLVPSCLYFESQFMTNSLAIRVARVLILVPFSVQSNICKIDSIKY